MIYLPSLLFLYWDARWFAPNNPAVLPKAAVLIFTRAKLGKRLSPTWPQALADFGVDLFYNIRLYHDASPENDA